MSKQMAASKVAIANEMLSQGGDVKEIEAFFREGLRLDPASVRAGVGLAKLLVDLGRPDEAVTLTSQFVSSRAPQHAELAIHGAALKSAGRFEEAQATYRRALTENPASPIAAHNLASILGDLSRFRQSEATARQALALGSDVPETWLVLARALQGLGRIDESADAYYQTLHRARYDVDAHRELAQLIWMATGSRDLALARLDQSAQQSGSPALLELKAVTQKYCGDTDGAAETINQAALLFPNNAQVRTAASHFAILAGQFSEGLQHAKAAVACAPRGLWTRLAFCEALLAIGDAAQASLVAEELRQESPTDQLAIAYQATAWRLLQDERYKQLFDYESFVSSSSLIAPRGWANLESFLADLTSVLNSQHVFKAGPFNQSIISGTQISNLVDAEDEVIRALFGAFQDPIKEQIGRLGKGTDAVRSRNTGSVRYEGVWSVRLNGGQGRHVDHVHHKGWISSACYISLPSTVTEPGSQAGQLSFGRPGLVTQPALGSDHFVKPTPGTLVLFPSYMWHGTESFAGDDTRLTVAFDLLPI